MKTMVLNAEGKLETRDFPHPAESLSKRFPTVTEFANSGKPCRVQGRVVIQFGQFPDCEELAPDYTASVLGWHRESPLAATCPNKQTLLDYCEARWPGCEIQIADGV